MDNFFEGFFECPADPRSTTRFSSYGSCRSKDRSTLISTLDDPLIRVHLDTLELGLFAALKPRRNRQRKGGKSLHQTGTEKPQIRPALPFPHRTFCNDFAGPDLSLQHLRKRDSSAPGQCNFPMRLSNPFTTPDLHYLEIGWRGANFMSTLPPRPGGPGGVTPEGDGESARFPTPIRTSENPPRFTPVCKRVRTKACMTACEPACTRAHKAACTQPLNCPETARLRCSRQPPKTLSETDLDFDAPAGPSRHSVRSVREDTQRQSEHDRQDSLDIIVLTRPASLRKTCGNLPCACHFRRLAPLRELGLPPDMDRGAWTPEGVPGPPTPQWGSQTSLHSPQPQQFSTASQTVLSDSLTVHYIREVIHRSR